jgi:CBS domain-containing protein
LIDIKAMLSSFERIGIAMMETTMNVLHIMTPHAISVLPEDTIQHAIELMLNNRISGLPVIDKNQNLVGILSEGDFLRRTEIGTERRRNRWLSLLLGPGRLANEYVHSHSRKVQEIMTRDPVTISEYTPLEDVARLMEQHHIKRLPVMRDDKVVGMVTRANLIQAIAARGHAIPPLTASDQAIRIRILNEIDKQPWAPAPLINGTVKDGVVEVFGVVTDGRQDDALKVLIENTRGVKSVKDELTWIEPMSGTVILPTDEKGQRKVIAH